MTSGMAIYDTMQYIRPQISTLVFGQAASAGSLLLMAGQKGKRFALPNSRIMIHQPSGGAQGTASDIIKLAMVRLAPALAARGLRSRMLLQVHDELVFEVAPGEGERLAELVRREMEGVYQLEVPLEVSMATGRSWAEAQH